MKPHQNQMMPYQAHLSTKPSVTVAKMMLDTAKEKCQKAMDSLDNIRKQKKSLDETKHKLLVNAFSSTEFGQKKWKSNDEEASAKKLKPSVGKSQDKKLRWPAYI